MRVITPSQADIDVWARSALADRWTGSGTMARHVASAAKNDVAMDGGLSAFKIIDPRLAEILCELLYGKSAVEMEVAFSDPVMLRFKGYKVKQGFFSKPVWGAMASVADTKTQMGLGCFAARSIPNLFDIALQQQKMDEPKVYNTLVEAVQNL